MSAVSDNQPAAVQRGDRFLDTKETCRKVGVKSKATLYAMERSRGFPSRIHVHAGRVVYLESDVEAWMGKIVAQQKTKPNQDSK